jgi:polar amino acid transport system ATP-binding protein/sulfate transport system ATP-binding protein
VTDRGYEVKDVLVSIRDVGLSFGDTHVLRGVTAEVRDIVRPGVAQGQVVGILGPSGTGKTQLSRILAGLQDPSSGSVSVARPDGTLEPVRAGLVGVVAQHYPLLRHRTVLGNLEVAAGMSGRDRPRERSLEMLARFDLADRAGFFPSQLSGGQRQRVAIAQQLLCSERLVIMDEPFTGLDPIMKDRTCDLIRQVSLMDEHNTIFVVAHDIHAVASISDTLWLIGRDREPASGQPVAGSRIQASYDLAAMGLAWSPGASETREFAILMADVRDRFRHL